MKDRQFFNQSRRNPVKDLLSSCPQGIQPLARLDLIVWSGKPRELREDLEDGPRTWCFSSNLPR